MEQEPLILETAYKHGVTEKAMLHALRFPVRRFAQEDNMVVYVGPDETGILIEVGLVEWHGILTVAHAMRPARTKCLR